jgi:DNA polymerase type B, organellar and viral
MKLSLRKGSQNPIETNPDDGILRLLNFPLAHSLGPISENTFEQPVPPNSFVMWDGETPRDTGYSLFGSTAGDYICHPFISTIECLDLVLASRERNPETINFGFAFDYDVNMILGDLDWYSLSKLRDHNATTWKGYQIKHIPGKWFEVRRDGITSRIYDVFSFFHSSYIATLSKYEIGTKAQRDYIELGKDKRSTFLWRDISYIATYWAAETSLGPYLMDELRKRCYDAGYKITSWHGPGALARYAIRQHKIKETCMGQTPFPVWIAARYAYTGGRFEQFLAGYHNGPVRSYDLNSAYPYACAKLPNLQTGRWVHYGPNVVPDNRYRFGLYRVRYAKEERQVLLEGPQPLFRRLMDGRVIWGGRVESWYWGPEAWNVRNDPHAEFLEAWVHEDDGTRPFEWINEAFERRRFLKSIGHPSELAIKLMLNAMTGQFAQRVGWRRKGEAPPTHQLEYAGYITSVCKSLVWEVAKEAWERDGLISIDTDGVFTREPIEESLLPNGIGKDLGQWERSEYSGILSWQNGVYWPRNGEEWAEPKSRGAPRGKIKIEHAWTALQNWEPIRFESTIFVGYGLALNNQFKAWRTWRTHTREVAFGGDFHSKRFHADKPGPIWNMCRKCHFKSLDEVYTAGMHDLIPINAMPDNMEYYEIMWSKMHYLPWIDDGEKKTEWDFIDLDLDWIWPD